ncbi:MAG: phosphoribosylamine--glycine ligase [Fimbriimonadaceae bacterium]
MRVLVVGSGGREHALAWRLAQEVDVHAAPGNPGMAEVAACHAVTVDDIAGQVRLAKDLGIDLVVVGPEAPLAAGLADQLRDHGISTFGPGQDGARLESSKAFSKELMAGAGVPTAAHQTFDDPSAAKAYAAHRFAEGTPVVIKADGLAAGKGVTVCSTVDEAIEAIEDAMEARSFGASGERIVIEDRLVGREFSLIAIVSGTSFVSLPVAQDYKRALTGDRGPNTGGMGSFSPCGWLSDDAIRKAEERVIAPIMSQLAASGIDYRGALFAGLMLVNGEPMCIEFNVRMGDPETQSVLPRLEGSFVELLDAAAGGGTLPPVSVSDRSTVTVVLASGGYPGEFPKGLPIQIGDVPSHVHLFHAGTALRDGQLVTSGGRVLGVTAVEATIEDARAAAYQAAECIAFEGKFYRTDIAA